MKKQILTTTLILILMIVAATPALATETFEGPDAGLFGRPTSVDESITVGGYPT